MHSSKAFPPLAGPVLERERLLNRLLAWEDKKLVIVHGQAGQGKSTLAASFVRSRPSPSAWYTLDRGDADPAVFLAGLGQAIQRTRTAPLPPPPPAPRYRYGMSVGGANIAAWTADVFAGFTRPLLIVLDDDGGASASPDLRAILASLMESTPPEVRFLFLSRSRPELALAKLRARQAVAELSGDDLRFNREETHHLFTTVFGMRIGKDETAAVSRLTEGWPAGLVLIHEWLASSPQSASALLSSRRRPAVGNHVFEYLAQEVFHNLSSDIQRFLLRTSLVEQLTPELMKLLAGGRRGEPRGPSVGAMAEELKRRNLFVSSPGEGGVIQYHPLFREFLRSKFEAEAPPGEVKRLAAAAAEHLGKKGDIVGSIDLCLATGQTERAVALIEASGGELITGGRTRTLLVWMEELPRRFTDRPWFVLFRAMTLRFSDPRTALPLFERAFSRFRRSGNKRAAEGMMFSLAGIVETCFYAGADLGRMKRAAVAAEQLLARSKGAAEARARLLLALGTTHFFGGRLQESAGSLERALELFRKQGDAFSEIQSAIYLAPCRVYQGDFGRAREAVRKGFEALRRVPEEKGGEAALHTARAMTALNEGKFEEARECVERCGVLAREHRLAAFDFLSLTVGGWVRLASGEHDEAERFLGECRLKGKETKNDFFTASAAHLLSLNALHRGRLSRARAEADIALKPSPWTGSRLFHAASLAASGAIRLKQGDIAAAGRELRKSLAFLREIGAAQQEANAHLLLASLSLRMKKEGDAREHLRAGFGIGQERGFFYYGTIAADDLRELAERAQREGICAEYCGALLRDHLPERTAPGVRIQMLGRFMIFRDNEPIADGEWKSRRAKMLVKLLAAHGNRKLGRDAARDILWPDDHGGGGPQGFSSLLHRVRKVLGANHGPACILQEEEQLELDRSAVMTDIAEFEDRVRRAERLAGRKEHDEALTQYRKAFELYQGDFLPDDLYDDWTVPFREKLRGDYRKALESAAAIADNLEREDEVAVFYEKLFENDPCGERACRRLMAHYVAGGRRADAVRTYERCQRALERELEAEPEEETRRLHRRIIGG